MRELEKLLQAIEQEVEDGELPRVYLVYVERVREEQATQQNARLTPESLASSQALSSQSGESTPEVNLAATQRK